ncbi:MAG: NTP transferase domain-containing protein [Candidatus Lokiarchaeota archaeon]|nr:NTP transferase domain-containing protein [Candidatus Lokiarchaeota archaeon]
MTDIKAVILAAGTGKRLEPITVTRPKHLIPVAGKPILQYTIESLKNIGISDILLIVGYKKEQITNFFKDGTLFGVNINYIEQKKYLGTANATQLAENFISNEPFLLIYGDLLMDSRIYQKILSQSQTEKNIIACKNVENPTKYGVVTVDAKGYVKKIIEKPLNDSFGNLINAGVYLFSPSIFTSIEKTPKSSRNEYELTDAIELFLREGNKMRALNVSDEYWNDIGRPWDILEANQYFLDKVENENHGVIEEGVTIHGKTIIGANTIIKSGTYIEGPVYIGENCTIGPNSYIRPYTSLGNNVRIGNSCEVKNSVVFSRTHISHLSYLGDSIIGENVNFGAGTIISNVRLDKKDINMDIKGMSVNSGLKKLGAVIGDNVQLGINSMIMVGKKIGTNSSIGPGTIVDRDVPNDTIYYVKYKCVNEKFKYKEM